nr:hypothetical protein CKG001_06890 [Bdellovibrio sp. CKG001]
MKTLFAIALFSFLFSLSSAQATEDVSAGLNYLNQVLEVSQDISGGTDKLSSSPETQTYTCRAWTRCYNGYTISCWARGYGCYAEYIPGYRVYCEAWDRWGNTRYAVDYCY